MNNHFLTITGLGAITNDPKTIDSSNGVQCLLLSLAAREFFMDKNGTAQTSVTYIDTEYWASPETIKNLNIKKGDLVEFKGKLNESSWEVKDTGEKRKKHFVRIRTLRKFEE